MKVLLAGLTFLAIAGSCLPACRGRDPIPAVHAGFHLIGGELAIEESIARENGYAPEAVEVMAGRTNLRVLIHDSKLAEADMATRATAADAVVATIDKALAANPEFPEEHSVSISIVHPANFAEVKVSAHIEEVFEYRRGADQRFTRSEN